MRGFRLERGTIIGAMHLPALPGSPRNTRSVDEIVEFAVRNAKVFELGGVDALYLQNAGDGMGPKWARCDTVATMSVVAREVHTACSLPLGITLTSHDAAGAMAVAVAAGASFVRLKVFVGAMLKAEGVIEGCAAEALSERRRLNAEHVAIFADVHDRTGVSLGVESVELAADWASRFGDADALIITGSSPAESVQLLRRVESSGCRSPLLCGGSVTEDNVGELLEHCQGVIVSSSLMTSPRDDDAPWDPSRIGRLVQAARGAVRS